MRWETKTPPVLGQRATIYRGTTSCSPSPHGIRPYRVLTHPIAITGEPDTSLLAPSGLSEGCSGMYSHAPSSPLFTGQRFSLQVLERVTSSLHHGNFIKLPLLYQIFSVCQHFFRNMKIIYKSHSPEESISSFRREISPPATTVPPLPAAWSPSHDCRR